MRLNFVCLLLIFIVLFNCNANKNRGDTNIANNEVSIIGAMKNVMWKGELQGVINLDTIKNRDDLYGLGPLSYLTGEILINNGISYNSKVLSDSTMLVEKSFKIEAPFFVYTNVKDWEEINLPKHIKTIIDLETYIEQQYASHARPFAFKLEGLVESATIHIQNLPEGSLVSSPQEAHQGQINYSLKNERVEIIGFFSKNHQGIFTHHDSFLHMHLITADETKMGHLDEVSFNHIKLFLPKI